MDLLRHAGMTAYAPGESCPPAAEEKEKEKAMGSTADRADENLLIAALAFFARGTKGPWMPMPARLVSDALEFWRKETKWNMKGAFIEVVGCGALRCVLQAVRVLAWPHMSRLDVSLWSYH